MEWTKKDIIKYYLANELAYRFFLADNFHFGYWDGEVKNQKQASARFNEVLAGKAGITERDHVLDAGCGVGGCSIYLAKTFGCRCTGITITPRQVVIARERAEEAGVAHLTDFYEMDYEKTAFEDKRFTVVWGLESICYATSKKGFIKEAHRVLTDDGRLVVADGFASKETYDRRENKMMSRWLDGWRVNFLNTPAQFAQFAAETGFRSSCYTNVTDRVWRTSRLLYHGSLFFLPLHLVNTLIPLKSYPTDGMYHQYLAMKHKLWEYGIFMARKQG